MKKPYYRSIQKELALILDMNGVVFSLGSIQRRTMSNTGTKNKNKRNGVT
jgi:hypothetical protein